MEFSIINYKNTKQRISCSVFLVICFFLDSNGMITKKVVGPLNETMMDFFTNNRK